MAIVIPSSPQINNNERHFVSEYFTNLSNSTIDEEQPHEESPPASPLLDHKDRHAPPILRCYSDPTSGDDYSPPSSSSHSPPDSSPNYNMTCHTTPTSPQTSYRGISSLNAPPQPPITPIYDGDCTCHDCMTYAAMTISSQAPSRGESRYGTPRTSRAGSRAMSRSSIVSTPTNTSPTSSHRTLSTTTTRSSISSGNETPQELPDDPLDKDYIGPFKLGETLGKGQSGYVRVGRHVDTGFEAAFKIIDKNTLQNDPKQWHKIMREIVILKLMEHPHVLKLYDVLETKKNIYMVLEYVKGGELFQYIISKGRLDRHESLRLIAQLIQGLEHCHAYNISHRDLKPENILLDEQKNIKIADFGMALLTKRGQLQRTRCGSPHYVSPEVIEGRSYDPKVSDVWSVGVIFYAMLTGCHPFDHENVAVLLSLITQGKYSIPFYVDPDVTDLLRRMLVVEPSKRIELSAIKHHPVFKKKKYFIDAHITPPPCAPAVTPTIIVSDVAQAHTLEEQLDENVLKDLEALGLGWGTRDELRQKIVASSALNGEPSIEKCFYDRLLARRQSRRDELSRLSPRPMEPRIPHSPIPRTVRPTHHLSLPGPITIAGTALPRPPSTGMHVRRTSSTSSHLHDLKPVIHVSIPMNTDGYDDLEMPPGLPWGDGILIIPPSLHAATNHHQQIYQSMANHFAHSHHKNEHPHGHHHSPSPHHHHTHHSPSPHHHNQHSHHHHQQPSTPHHQPSSRNPHRHTVTSTTPGSTSISPSPAIHVSSNSNVCHTTPTSPRRHSITNETHKTVSFKHQHHSQTPRGQDNDEVSFSPFLSPFSSKPSSPPSTPPSTPKAKTRALEAAAASSDVTMTPFTISPPSSSHPIPMDETPTPTPTMMEQVRTIAYTRGEQRGSIKQNTINNKKTQVKSQPKSKSWFSSIFAVKPSLNIMSGGIPSTSRPPLQQPQSYVPQQPQQPQSQSHSQDVHMSDV